MAFHPVSFTGIGTSQHSSNTILLTSCAWSALLCGYWVWETGISIKGRPCIFAICSTHVQTEAITEVHHLITWVFLKKKRILRGFIPLRSSKCMKHRHSCDTMSRYQQWDCHIRDPLVTQISFTRHDSFGQENGHTAINEFNKSNESYELQCTQLTIPINI